MLKYLLFSLLRTTAFSKCLFFGLVLNHHTLAATALDETYSMPIVKKYNQFIVWIDLLGFVFAYKKYAVLNIFCLDTPY